MHLSHTKYTKNPDILKHMDNNKLADSVVKDIHKDFLIVGKHRVHSWYAWAMVGIVFGMALGIVYVANRSAQFNAGQAAAGDVGKVKVYFNSIPAAGTLHDALYTGTGFVIADRRDRALAASNPTKIPGNPSISYSGEYIDQNSNYFDINRNNLGALYISSDGKDAWFSKAPNDRADINLSGAPFATSKKIIELKFKNFIKKSGAFVELPAAAMTGDFLCGFDLAGSPGPCTAANRLFHVAGGNSIKVPQGMPLYARSAATRPALKIVDGAKTYGDPDIKLPGFERSGAIELYWNDVVAGANKNVEVVDIKFVPAPNKAPVFNPTKDQYVEVEKTLTFTVSASDPEGDPTVYTITKGSYSFTTLSGSGVFAITPPIGLEGVTLYPLVRATDNQGAFSEQEIKIHIIPPTPQPIPLPPPIDNASRTLTLALSSATPYVQTLTPGTTNATLVKVNLRNGSVDAVRLTAMKFFDNASKTAQSFLNFTLYDGATKLAGPVSIPPGTDGSASFDLGNGLIIAKNSVKELTLKGDVATTGNGTHAFGIVSNAHIVGRLVGNNSPATVNGAPIYGNQIRINQTTLSLTAMPMIGSETNRPRSLDRASFIVTAGPGNVTLQKIDITFSGKALATGASPFNVSLLNNDETSLGSAANPQVSFIP